MHGAVVGDSKLAVGVSASVSVHGCLSLCVGSAIGCQTPALQDRLQDKAGTADERMDGHVEVFQPRSVRALRWANCATETPPKLLQTHLLYYKVPVRLLIVHL